MSRWVDQVQVASSSSDKVYTVSRKEGTDLYGCSCQGWITHGHCKHLTKLGKESAKQPPAVPAVPNHLSYTCPVCGHRRGNHYTKVTNAGCTAGGDCDCVLIADDIVRDGVTSATVIIQQHRNPRCTNWINESILSVPEARDENTRLGWDKYRWWRES